MPCVPVALNSGLFWPRRALQRLPGTIVVEFLPAIAPGLDKDTFMRRLQADIETATARLIAEGAGRARKPWRRVSRKDAWRLTQCFDGNPSKRFGSRENGTRVAAVKGKARRDDESRWFAG